MTPTRWPAWAGVVALAVLAKGFAFLREPVIAATFGMQPSADGYYLAVGLPFLLYNLLGMPFSLWVTARLAAVTSGGGGLGGADGATRFYRRSLRWGITASVVLAIGLALGARAVVRAYAPGLQGDRSDLAAGLVRIGALALPALVLQAVCAARLFAEQRFITVYAWLTAGGLIGLAGVILLTPIYGPDGAVFAFGASWWTAALGLVAHTYRSRSAASMNPPAPWGADLGAGVAYRALAMQLFFQGNALLVYNFASRLATGEIAAALFAGKIVMAIYETLVLTAGVLVFPQIARFVHEGDESATGRATIQALNWLLPVTVALMVLVAVSRTELVTLIYRRRAFDARATALVSRALLGYAPYVLGTTLLEILHRAMVLRGRLAGYLLVFGAGLAVNIAACAVLVRPLGLMGVTLGSSIGVLAVGAGLWMYAARRLPGLDTRQILVLVGRTLGTAVVGLVLLSALHARLPSPSSTGGSILVLLATAVSTAIIFIALLAMFGHRWIRVSPTPDMKAL